MQFKIPQNVRREDKIVGPLTLKQLITLGLGGGITYAVYTILASRYYIEVWLLPTAFLGLTTLAFTFLQINGIPFGKWLLLGMEYFVNPKKRTFLLGAADHYTSDSFKTEDSKKMTVESQETLALKSRDRLKKISEISKLVDSTPHGA